MSKEVERKDKYGIRMANDDYNVNHAGYTYLLNKELKLTKPQAEALAEAIKSLIENVNSDKDYISNKTKNAIDKARKLIQEEGTMTQIEQAKQALQKKFPGTIDVFPFQGKTAVMHRGIYKGSYNDVMSAPKKDYEITIGKKKYDTRKAMTSELFDAAFEYWKNNVSPIPYSSDAKEDGWWPWAIMTGEDLTADGFVQIRDVYEGQVRRCIHGPDRDGRALRVCPAVVLDVPFGVSPSSESLPSTELARNTEALNRLSDILERVFK